MRPDLAERTYEILLQGLTLRDRLRSGSRPSVGSEQSKFKSLLGPANAATPWGSSNDPTRSVGMEGGEREFLGIRYALTCWLDEVLIEAGWREWDENKLESALYRTNVRYSNFWQQARLGEAIPETADAQEAFYLCVALGFRGELGEEPQRLKDWASAARNRATKSVGKEPAPLPERAPVTDVPALLGIDRYRKMTRRLLLGVLVAIPVTVFFVALLFRSS